MTKAASPLFSPLASRNGRAASNACTAPSTSSRKFCSHDAGSWPCAMAPALANSRSMPPSSLAAPSTHAFSAAPSLTSTVPPVARMPPAFSSATVAATCSALRAHTATLAPSPASVAAIARPMPRVPPSTMAFFPLRPRSIVWFSFLLIAGSVAVSRGAQKPPRRSLGGAPATKQSRLPLRRTILDCFAALAMTVWQQRRPHSGDAPTGGPPGGRCRKVSDA
ncbi:hypothetical protein ACVWYH_000448 [Bradyrhizobium sp. GM24.11]